MANSKSNYCKCFFTANKLSAKILVSFFIWTEVYHFFSAIIIIILNNRITIRITQ